MSQNYDAYTLALPQMELPSKFDNEKDILQILESYWNKLDPDFSEAFVPDLGQNRYSGSQYILDGSTRNGWAYWAIANLNIA